MAESRRALKIAIVHYHLKRGGVTRVIESARSVLQEGGNDVLVLSGEAPLSDAIQNNVRVVSGLNYRKTGNSVIAGSLVEALKKEAEAHFGSRPDVWHFHNPTLAKNVLIPTVVKELAEEGARIVLQLHDFAEDGRPGTTRRSVHFSILSPALNRLSIPPRNRFTMRRSINGITIFSRKRGFSGRIFMSFQTRSRS